MSTDFKLDAETRTDLGKGASRRLRRLGDKVPAIIYGDEKEPHNISLLHKDFIKQLENESFYSQVITLSVDSKPEEVILKDLQRHPAKNRIMHADFLRVSKTKKLHTKVPLHFLNETNCVGVKQQGGAITHNMTELDISCLAKDLPEFIEVDLSNLEIGASLHISDLTLPAGVESTELAHGGDHDLPVVTVYKPRGVSEDTDDEGASEDTPEEGGDE